MPKFRFTQALLLLALAFTLLAQQRTAPSPQKSPKGIPVVFNDETLFHVYVTEEGVAPEERAQNIAGRVSEFARNRKIPVDAVKSRDIGIATLVYARNVVLLAITDEEAAAAGKPRDQLTAEYTARIREAVNAYREQRAWSRLILGGFYSLLVTLILAAFLWLLRWATRHLRLRIERAVAARRLSVRIQQTELISPGTAGSLLLSAVTAVKWAVVLVLIDIYVPLVLGFFPGTVRIATSILSWVFSPLQYMWSAVIDYLPELFFLVVLGIITYYLTKVINFFFREMGESNIRIQGFYPEWAEPTGRLVRLLVIILALVVAYPYLPGSRSPAFQGISIFLGVLVSIGGSSTIANLISGLMLTYMRAYRIGDYVKIGEHVGNVVERNLLVTRIETIRHVVVTVSNTYVMGAQIVNYSTSSRNPGLTLSTSVTIGYGAPWRTVHQLLIDAALSTKHILHEPEPFVLQTALSDFYVNYQINAFTDQPNLQEFIYGELHQNIQEKFNEGGVEIMSPHYTQIRDGNEVTIPASYLAKDYRPGGLRITHVPDPDQPSDDARP